MLSFFNDVDFSLEVLTEPTARVLILKGIQGVSKRVTSIKVPEPHQT